MPEPAFEPIYPNPYIAGNPIRSQEMFFGRLDEFHFIARALEGGQKTALIVLFGERRSGKSSILYQILNGRLGEAFLPIFVDMQILAGISSDAEFFSRIITDSCKQLARNGLSAERYQPMLRETTAAIVFRQFLQELKSHFPDRALLMLIDEYEFLEAKINEGSLSQHLLTFFAGLLETDLVSFVFTGSKSLETHDRTLWGEELFRKATSRKISFLTKDDTERLITQPLQNKVVFAPEVVAQIYTLTAGQPFYTQIICQELVYYLNEVQERDVTLADLESVVNRILENPPPQLIFNWSEHSSEHKLALSLLAEFSEAPQTFLSATDLCNGVKRKKLALNLDANFFLTELSSLSQDEYVLQKNREYAFRLDLYRRWVRHDHNIWQVKKEIGAREIARTTKQTKAKKERKQRAIRILERVGEVALAATVIWLLAWLVFERKRSVIVKANGGPFEVWVGDEKYGSTKGRPDSTQFEILDGFAIIKNYILTLGSGVNKDSKFKTGLTKDKEYNFTVILSKSGEKVSRSDTIRKDGQILEFEFKTHPVEVITNAESAEIQLGGDSTQIKANKPDAWRHEFRACAGTYLLRAKDRGTGEVKLDTVTVPSDAIVKMNFDSVVVATFVAKDSFTCTFSWSKVQVKRRSIPKTGSDSFMVVLQGLFKGSHRFAFTNLRTQEDITVHDLIRADTTISLKFNPNYRTPRGNGGFPSTPSTAQSGKTSTPKELRLSFVSVPPGAGVYSNGVHWNNTPFDTTLKLDENSYSFIFKKDGYKSATKQVKLTKSDTLSVKLVGQYGYLKLVVQDELGRSLPDVKVFVGGDYKGETPINEIKLLAIEHALHLDRSGTRKDTSFVIVKDDTLKLTLKMTKRL